MRRRARVTVIIAEVALATVLLVGARLFVRGFVRLAEQEPGFRPERSVTVNVELPYGNPTPLAQRGWQGPVGTSAYVHSGERIPLNLGGTRHRFYLIWMTTLPPAKQSAQIAEVTLLK